MPKKLHLLRGPLQTPLYYRLQTDWKKKWLPGWERRHGPSTITAGEAAYLIYGSLKHEEWARPCSPPPKKYPQGWDDPFERVLPGWVAPIGVRAFAAFFARAPDECLDFMCWCRKYAAKIDATDFQRALVAADELNFIAKMVGGEFCTKAIAEAAGGTVSDETVEKAVAHLRKRNPEKRTRKKSG